MFQEEDPLLRRLKELSLITKPTEKEFLELEQIKKDLGMDQDTSDSSEPIPQIKNYRHQLAENRRNEEQLRLLVQQRKELELKLSLRREKERIEKAKKELDGMVYCDDCLKWVWPDHFD